MDCVGTSPAKISSKRLMLDGRLMNFAYMANLFGKSIGLETRLRTKDAKSSWIERESDCLVGGLNVNGPRMGSFS